MAVSKEPGTRNSAAEKTTGLTAYGRSGPWEIAIDESIAGPDRWFAQIEGPSVYVYFEIPSPDLINETMQFLDCGRADVGHGPRAATLTLGASRSMPVNLVRDDEFSDRCFLVIEGQDGLHVRFTFAGEDLTHLIESLRQAKEDLSNGTES
jgi:hypothetical protein